MANDPYKVLGVKRGASQAEIKSAYKKLVKKYHPDRYHDNPLADLAEEKLREINEAYDTLTKDSAGAYSNPNDYGVRSAAGMTGDYLKVRQLIDANRIAEAENILIHHDGRDAEWYFLSGMIAFKRGRIADGMANLQEALRIEPDNQEYRRYYTQMQRVGSMFAGSSDNLGYGQHQASEANACCQLLPCYLCCCPDPFCIGGC